MRVKYCQFRLPTTFIKISTKKIKTTKNYNINVFPSICNKKDKLKASLRNLYSLKKDNQSGKKLPPDDSRIQ